MMKFSKHFACFSMIMLVMSCQMFGFERRCVQIGFESFDKRCVEFESIKFNGFLNDTEWRRNCKIDHNL